MRWICAAVLLAGCGSDASSPASPNDSGVPVDSALDTEMDAFVEQNGTRPKLVWSLPVEMGIPSALGIDAKGSFIVGEWPPNGSHPDAKVRAFDVAGLPQWTAASKGPAYAFNSAGESIGGALDQVGSSAWSLNVARVDDAGMVRFSKTYGNEVGIHFYSVGLDSAGNGYLSGDFTKPLDFGSGPVTSTGDEPFIVELDSTAKPLWMQQYPKTSGISLAVDSTGGLFVGTKSSGQDFGDGAVDGAVLVSLGSDHAFRWAIRGGANAGYIGRMVADGAGGGAFTLTGKGASSWAGQSFEPLGEDDIAIVSFDATGKTRFIRRLAVVDVVWNHTLAFSKGGDLVVSARQTDGTMDLGQGVLTAGRFHPSAYLGRYDSTGKPKWTARYGNGGDCYIDAIAFGSDETLLVAGNTAGSVDLNGAVITVATGKKSQAFLARLGP